MAFFQLIAGERRWRASQRAGLTRVPAVVRESRRTCRPRNRIDRKPSARDLNPIEEAQAYERLIAEFALTQDESPDASQEPGARCDMLRLLRLPPEVQRMLRKTKLRRATPKRSCL